MTRSSVVPFQRFLHALFTLVFSLACVSFAAAQTETILHTFPTGSSDGFDTDSGLIADASLALYGVTHIGCVRPQRALSGVSKSSTSSPTALTDLFLKPPPPLTARATYMELRSPVPEQSPGRSISSRRLRPAELEPGPTPISTHSPATPMATVLTAASSSIAPARSPPPPT